MMDDTGVCGWRGDKRTGRRKKTQDREEREGAAQSEHISPRLHIITFYVGSTIVLAKLYQYLFSKNKNKA